MIFFEENQIKSKSGKEVKTLIHNVLQPIADAEHFKVNVSANYAIGYPEKNKQFKMDFQVEFSEFNDEKWLIKGTSSARSDRIYGNEFMAQNIRIIDPKVSKIFLVVPDSISKSEQKSAINYASKIKSGTYTSFITDVITVNELARKIISKATINMTQGTKSNILGNNSEQSIVNLLNDKNNIALWNDYTIASRTTKSSTYVLFKTILLAVGFVEGIDIIESTKASTDIPRLSNNGYPKTDVTVEFKTKEKFFRQNISIKNTESKEVTIHEGDIRDLINALEIDFSSPLALALLNFQEVGSRKRLLEEYPDSVEILDNQLRHYNETLLGFFVFGDKSPLVTDSKQIANMLIFTHNFETYTKSEYIQYYLEAYKSKGQFGTPFKWTYPSKKRGNKFQIKGFTNNP